MDWPSIPAPPEEPRRTAETWCRLPTDPRACGGTRLAASRSHPVMGLSRQGKTIPSTENRQQPRTTPKLQHPCNSGTKLLRKTRRETTAVIRREAKGQECWIGNHRCFAAHHSSPSCRGSDRSGRTHRQRPTQNHRRLIPLHTVSVRAWLIVCEEA